MIGVLRAKSISTEYYKLPLSKKSIQHNLFACKYYKHHGIRAKRVHYVNNDPTLMISNNTIRFILN